MKSESELRKTVSKSQKEEFRKIFSKYSSYVYVIIWNHIRGVGTHEDAEETVSDVFADLYRNLDKVEDGKLESYIRTLAKRAAIDTFRRLTARPEQIMGDEKEWQEALSDEDVEKKYEMTELRATLISCILSLGEPDASIVMMKYFYDNTAEDISKQIGMNQATVYMHLTRARRRLRKLLKDTDIVL